MPRDFARAGLDRTCIPTPPRTGVAPRALKGPSASATACPWARTGPFGSGRPPSVRVVRSCHPIRPAASTEVRPTRTIKLVAASILFMPSLSDITIRTARATTHVDRGQPVVASFRPSPVVGRHRLQPPPPPARTSCVSVVLLRGRLKRRADGADVHFDTPRRAAAAHRFEWTAPRGQASTFPIGETTVSCTAIDADTAQAACGFLVRVRVSQMLSRTKFRRIWRQHYCRGHQAGAVHHLGRPDTYPSNWRRCCCTVIRPRHRG